MKRTVLILTGLLLSLPVSPALAQEDYPPDVLGLTLSDATLSCPAPTTVRGEGFPSGSEVDVFLNGDRAATATAGEPGNFSVTVDVPGGTGQHTISASAGGETAAATVTCVAGAAAGGVAFTGTNITVGLLLLFGLIVAGSAALVAGRRRARSSA
jgi:hypothetical protein